jgi:hypothetical protein
MTEAKEEELMSYIDRYKGVYIVEGAAGTPDAKLVSYVLRGEDVYFVIVLDNHMGTVNFMKEGTTGTDANAFARRYFIFDDKRKKNEIRLAIYDEADRKHAITITGGQSKVWSRKMVEKYGLEKALGLVKIE